VRQAASAQAGGEQSGAIGSREEVPA